MFSIGKSGSRKVLICLILLVTGIVVVSLKGDIPSNFLILMQTLAGAFVAGNSVEHIAGAFRRDPQLSSNIGAPEQATLASYGTAPDVTPPDEDDGTDEAIAELSQSVKTSNEALAYLVNFVKQANSGK